MASSDESDSDMQTSVDTLKFSTPDYLPEKSVLKPRLDSIFAEVEKSLPSIDFDVSDVSSDEDVNIFQRSLTTFSFLDDDEKDLDESLVEDDFHELLAQGDRAVKQRQDSSKTVTFQTGELRKDQERNHQVNHIESAPVPRSSKATKDQNTAPLTSLGSDRLSHDSSDFRPQTVSSLGSDRLNHDSSDFRPQTVYQGWINGDHDGVFTSHAVTLLSNGDLQNVNENSNNAKVVTSVGCTCDDLQDENSGKVLTVSNKKWGKPVKKPAPPKPRSDTVSREVVSQFLPEEPPTLSMGQLDQVNFDDVLNTIGSRNLESSESFGRDISIYAAAENVSRSEDTANDGQTLIEKLAQLSMSQSGRPDLQGLDPITGAVKKKKSKKKRTKSESKEEKTAINEQLGDAEESKHGLKNKWSPRDEKDPVKVELPPHVQEVLEETRKMKEPETVFLDLRNFEQTKKTEEANMEAVQRILQIEAAKRVAVSSDSSDDEEADMELWHEQRKRIRESLTTTGAMPEILPSKPKIQTKRETSAKSPRGVTQAQRLAKVSPKQKPAPIELTKEKYDHDQTVTPPNTPTEKQQVDQALEQEKQRRNEAARKLREQREAERQGRLRLGRQLEALRPKVSVKGRQSCAESTPTVFDVDASYEPAPQSLPGILNPETETLLLTVHLSSNGEVVAHRGSRSVEIGSGLSASYAALLTWLLSLVPNDFTFLQDPTSVHMTVTSPNYTPFSVLGLQQMWFNEQLCLIVAVTPREGVTCVTQPGKSKKAKQKDSCSPFQQLMTKFLSTNTLFTVCPWLQDLVPVEIRVSDQAAPEDAEKPFTYSAPLPTISTKPLSTFLQINPDPNAVQKLFSTPLGFFWQTVENEELHKDVDLDDEKVNYDTQNTMSLVYKKVFHNPISVMGIFSRILSDGLDLSGVRLVYPSVELLNMETTKPVEVTGACKADQQSNLDFLNNVGPILAIAIRGTFARTVWLDAVGPSDPSLARKTDPNSLCALYGGESRDECLLFCPRNPVRVQSELARWFGGRVPPSGVIDVGTSQSRKERHRSGSPKERKKKVTFSDSTPAEASIPTHRPPASLTATITGDIFLAISPLLPPRCLGIILATCEKRGYQLRGIRRGRLTSKKAGSLGIIGKELSVFCPEYASTPTSPVTYEEVVQLEQRSISPPTTTEPAMPCTLLLLHKENAVHNTGSLVAAFMVQLALKGILGGIQENCSHPYLTSEFLFHTAPYTDGLLAILGGDFNKIPEQEFTEPSYIAPKLYTNPELEQIVVVTVTGHLLLRTFGLFLGKLLKLSPHSKPPTYNSISGSGFELLGIKWLPSLMIHQAKELTPYELGDKEWKSSIQYLTSEPAMVLVLRGLNAFKRLSSIVNPTPKHSITKEIKLDKIMSATPETAYRQARMFFTDRELFPDPHSRVLLPYLPPVRNSGTDSVHGKPKRHKKMASELKISDFVEESIFKTMSSGPRLLTTLMIVKPDALRKHVNKIFKKMDHEGFSVVGLRLEMLDHNMAERLVPTEVQNAIVRQMHLDHLTSGPVLILCLQRENAVKKLVDLVGPGDPQQARRQSNFLWRGMFGVDPVCNGLHVSKDYNTSVLEQKLFFPEGLCCQSNDDLAAENISAPAVDSLSGIKLMHQRQCTFLEPNTTLLEATEHHGDGFKSSKGTRAMISKFSLPVTPLTQTNCIVFTPDLLKPQSQGRNPPYIELLDWIITHGFELVGARMVWFNREQAEHYLKLLDAGSFKLVPLLVSSPSIVLALQRDNAVMAFDTLLGGPYSHDSLHVKYGSQILRCQNLSVVGKHLTYFFGSLVPTSHASISQRTSD